MTLAERLADLHLTVDDLDVVDGVLDRLAGRPPRPHRMRWRVAAAVLLVLAVSVAAIPGSRRTVAGWLGLDSVRVERVPDLELPDGLGAAELPRPGATTALHIGDRTVLVSTIDARLDDVPIVKQVGAGTTVEEVHVGAHRGLWIAGADHAITFDTDKGRTVAIAGNTLLWESGDVLYRIEGLPELDAAIELADALAD